MSSVLIVAAEASSSLYARRLLEYWKEREVEVDAFGVGSRDLEELGFECLGRSEEMAVMGLQEVVKHFPLIRRVYNSILAEAEKRKPKFALLLDYPGFNLRLAKDLKKRGIKVIYYISPQVWAWKTGRVKLIRRVVDEMLVLFPFEVDFYREHGVTAKFVGHPLLDELPPEESFEAHKRHRNKFGLQDDEVALGIMPGSRRSEIEHNLKSQLEAAMLVVRKNPKIRPLLLVAPTLEREDMREAVAERLKEIGSETGTLPDFPIQVIKEDPLAMISLSDVILCASGTATLMVGLMEKPMVIMYRMNAITAWFAKRLVTKTPYFGLVNLIMNKRVVPELFQEEANPERMASEILKIVEDPAERGRVIGDLKLVKDRLGSRGATLKVAEILAPYLSSH